MFFLTVSVFISCSSDTVFLVNILRIKINNELKYLSYYILSKFSHQLFHDIRDIYILEENLLSLQDDLIF